MLTSNTFGSLILGAAGIHRAVKGGANTAAFSWFLALFAVKALTSAIFVLFQRRHLMVWAIFAPKFMFDGSALAVVTASGGIASLASALYKRGPKMHTHH